MVRGTFFLRSVNYFFRGFLTPLKNIKNPPWTTPHKNLLPWDHAQMIERKILCRIALTKALKISTPKSNIAKLDLNSIRTLIWTVRITL